MKWNRLAAIAALFAGLGLAGGPAPAVAQGPGEVPPAAGISPVPLEWVPPPLEQLNAMATVKSSFTLDRTMLAMATDLMPELDNDTQQAMRKLDGVSVHLMRFSDPGMVNEDLVDQVRAAYHLRGWKHMVTTTDRGGPVHDGTTDVWVVMDGMNLRGAVVLVETPRSLTLATVAGNLSPVDLLHLRGHFGIPRFDGDQLRDDRGR